MYSTPLKQKLSKTPGLLETNGFVHPRADGRRSIEVSTWFRWKRPLERGLAACLLVPGLPLIGLLMALVRLTSRGRAIYGQVRVGCGGRTFTIYKIRTMRQNAESGTGPVWTTLDDPRITFVGRILRSLHLDEFPQLFNIVRGEMSLIGPRPERPEFAKVLAQQIPGYLDRLAVQPGISGLAQINLPPDTDLDSVRRKLVLDCAYLREADWRLDLRIMVWTCLRLLGLPGERLSRLVGLYRLPVQIEPAGDDASAPAIFKLDHHNADGQHGGKGRGRAAHDYTADDVVA